MNPANEQIRQVVHDTYARIARQSSACCDPAQAGSPGCCAPAAPKGSDQRCCDPTQAGRPGCCASTGDSSRLGYSSAELASVPAGVDLGLGCGNPHAIAELKPGEAVLDLGSGGGLDAVLAARQIGSNGHVIGVDMTAAMIARARANAAGISNVEFRLGEIEHLPVADASIDVILSNCVINLAPDKAAVFAEAYRVLKPGGRLAISDIVAEHPLPATITSNLAAYGSCMAGATPIDTVRELLAAAGFTDIRVIPSATSRTLISEWLPGIDAYIVSATIQARKE